MNTILLLIMYQIFNSLLGHLPFSVNFFLHFYGVTFFGTPNIYFIVTRSHSLKGHRYIQMYSSSLSCTELTPNVMSTEKSPKRGN